MKKSLRQVSLVLLILAVLVSAIRAWKAYRLWSAPPPSIDLPAPAHAAPGENALLARMKEVDALALTADSLRPSGDPFRPPPPPKTRRPAAEPLYAIPRVLLFVEDEGGSSEVVLTFGPLQTPPLGAGDSFREWKVLSVGGGKAIVENGGIIYTLNKSD